MTVAGYTFVPSTLKRLAKGKIGVGTLMTIAAVGAVILGEVGEAAMLAFLFAISEGLEEYAVTRTRRGLRALLSLVPDTATVFRDGREQTVPPAELALGEIMIVKSGERIATDGTIRAGRTALDTSAITGESVPVEAGPGDEVFAGSDQRYRRARGRGDRGRRGQFAGQDREDRRGRTVPQGRGPAPRRHDRQTPGPDDHGRRRDHRRRGQPAREPRVWIERALVVLVAASPCALAIAVPVTVVAAIGAASKLGVLVKGGAALEALGRIRGIALDKTGTLTRNKPVVIDVATTNGATRDEVLAVAAALEARSEHPLAAAILVAADDHAPAEDVESVTSAGLTGRLHGAAVRLGRPGWIEPGPLADEVERMQHAGATAVLIERDGLVLGAVAVRDELRPEAVEVVAGLHRDGYHVAMLTGDNERTARALATDVGIDEVHADLRPEDKARIIDDLQGRRSTAMVGDGVNDAPALATADLGIAMGAMGTDVAIETADVALMGEDLRHLPQALAHARRSRRIMLQNVGLSLVIITGLMPLALFGVLGLAAVVLVHELAEIVVIANGVRAGRAQALTTGSVPVPAAGKVEART